MAIHASTAALEAELLEPTVTDRAPISESIKDQRRALQELATQINTYTVLIADAIEDERTPEVAGKFESLHQTMKAFNRLIAKIDDAQHKLGSALRTFESERDELLAVIEVHRGGAENPEGVR